MGSTEEEGLREEGKKSERMKEKLGAVSGKDRQKRKT